MKQLNLLLTFMLISNFVFSQTNYFIETFEDNQANDWILEDLWTVGDVTTLPGLAGGNVNSTTFLGFDDFTVGANYIGEGMAITPLIDLTTASAPLYFEVTVKFRNLDQFFVDEQFRILVSTDNGSNWEELIEYQATNWEKQIFDFDQYAGQSIRVAFEYTDGGGLNIGAAIDDVAIGNELSFTQDLNYTLTVDGGAMFSECAENIDYPITGVVYNKGIDVITSFDLLVDSGNEVDTYSFETNIITGEVYRYTVPEMLNTGTTPSSYTISIANINGSTLADVDETDNSWVISFDPVPTVEGTGVLLEEGAGMWCGNCPRGTTFIEEISKRFDKKVATVAVHTLDLLTNQNYADAIYDAGVLGFPSVLVNRDEIIDPDQIVAPVISLLSNPSLASIDVAGSQLGNDFTATVEVTFNQAMTANHNVSVIITEDNLSNASTSWHQINGYTQGQTHMGGFEFFPAFTPSSFWPYNHVGRLLIGSFEGVDAINGDFDNGDIVTHTFDPAFIPIGWNKDNLKVVAVITDQDGNVVNVISKKYDKALETDLSTSTKNLIDESLVRVYPNPTSDWLQVELNLQEKISGNIRLINLLGQTIISQQLISNDGVQQLELDLSTIHPGVYILQMEFNNKSLHKKITIQK